MNATSDLNDVAWFVRLVEAKSFSAAAKLAGVPTSTVSRAVARLEDALGVALVRRTTRAVELTPEGLTLFEGSAGAIHSLREVAKSVSEGHEAPRGLLRVTAPNDLGPTFVADVVEAYLARYPAVEVEVLLTQRRMDLLRERVDVALRAGQVDEPGLMVRKIGAMESYLAASPSYLARRGTPTTPADLSKHDLILFCPVAGKHEITLVGSRETVTVAVRSRLGADDFGFVMAALRDGQGIGMAPHPVSREDLAAGRVVRVLPGWHTTGGSLHFVYPATKHLPSKVAAFRDVVLERFALMARGA